MDLFEESVYVTVGGLTVSALILIAYVIYLIGIIPVLIFSIFVPALALIFRFVGKAIAHLIYSIVE